MKRHEDRDEDYSEEDHQQGPPTIQPHFTRRRAHLNILLNHFQILTENQRLLNLLVAIAMPAKHEAEAHYLLGGDIAALRIHSQL